MLSFIDPPILRNLPLEAVRKPLKNQVMEGVGG